MFAKSSIKIICLTFTLASGLSLPGGAALSGSNLTAQIDGLTAQIDGLTAQIDGLTAQIDGITPRGLQAK